MKSLQRSLRLKSHMSSLPPPRQSTALLSNTPAIRPPIRHIQNRNHLFPSTRRHNSTTTIQRHISTTSQHFTSTSSNPKTEPSYNPATTPSSHPVPTNPSSKPPSSSSTNSSPNPKPYAAALPLPTDPTYSLTFTCTPCTHRSTHTISKQGYHRGTVLVKCSGCGVRHLIADHLKIFEDKSVTIEDILRERGEVVRRGVVGDGGDVEFWEEGAVERREAEGEGEVRALM